MKRFLTLGLLLTVLMTTTVKAETIELHKMTLTCYYPTGNKTCSGIEPYYGIAASKKEWIGKTAIVYERKENGNIGDFIGTYEIQDTGGKNVRNGYVLDIFIENESQMIPTQKIYVQIVDSEG